MGLRIKQHLYYLLLIFLLCSLSNCYLFIHHYGKMNNFAQSCDSSFKNHSLLNLGGGYQQKQNSDYRYIFFYSDFSCVLTGYYTCEKFADFERQRHRSDSLRRITDGQGVGLFGFYRVSHDSVFVQRKVQYKPFEVFQIEEMLFILRGDTLIEHNTRTISGVRGWFSKSSRYNYTNDNLYVFLPTDYKPDSLAAFKTGREGRYTRALKRKFCKE